MFVVSIPSWVLGWRRIRQQRWPLVHIPVPRLNPRRCIEVCGLAQPIIFADLDNVYKPGSPRCLAILRMQIPELTHMASLTPLCRPAPCPRTDPSKGRIIPACWARGQGRRGIRGYGLSSSAGHAPAMQTTKSKGKWPPSLGPTASRNGAVSIRDWANDLGEQPVHTVCRPSPTRPQT